MQLGIDNSIPKSEFGNEVSKFKKRSEKINHEGTEFTKKRKGIDYDAKGGNDYGYSERTLHR